MAHQLSPENSFGDWHPLPSPLPPKQNYLRSLWITIILQSLLLSHVCNLVEIWSVCIMLLKCVCMSVCVKTHAWLRYLFLVKHMTCFVGIRLLQHFYQLHLMMYLFSFCGMGWCALICKKKRVIDFPPFRSDCEESKSCISCECYLQWVLELACTSSQELRVKFSEILPADWEQSWATMPTDQFFCS